MALDQLASEPLIRGTFLAILGVGFWAVGPLIGYYVWKRYRGDDEE